MTLKQSIKTKLSAKGFRVIKPDQVVSVPLMLEIIELLEKDNDAKIKALKKEIEELKRTVKGFEILRKEDVILGPGDLESKSN